MEYAHDSPVVFITTAVLLALAVPALTALIARRRNRARRPQAHAIRPLSEAERVRFAQSWGKALARYTLLASVAEADQLLTEVMRLSGFPIADIEQRGAHLSLDHPRVVANYRAAHDLALKSYRGQASTEDLRQALVHYRVLFEVLVEPPLRALAVAR